MVKVTIFPQYVTDDITDLEFHDEMDPERIASHAAGDWHYIGVRAVATLHFPYGADYITADLKSPGLWGIESDSSREYLLEVYEEQKQILIGMLSGMKDFEITN